jgi:hypothetical protein
MGWANIMRNPMLSFACAIYIVGLCDLVGKLLQVVVMKAAALIGVNS